jgi:beta-galactosidase
MDFPIFRLARRPMTLALAFVAVVGLAPALLGAGRDVLPLDDGWRFFKGEVSGAERLAFVDSQWQTVRLPHDWSIAGPFAETNAAGGAGAFLPSGVAWYRKQFTLPEADFNRRVFVEFDGVMQNSDVWINGMHLGHRPNGYVSFRYELPNYVLAFGRGTTNLLAVCADTSAQPASRWYAGAGIYRHVRLLVMDPVHIADGGYFISTPELSTNQATVRIQTTITNEASALREINVETRILSPDGETVGALDSSQTVDAGAAATVDQQIVFLNPRRWDLDAPNLYRAETTLRLNGNPAALGFATPISRPPRASG